MTQNDQKSPKYRAFSGLKASRSCIVLYHASCLGKWETHFRFYQQIIEIKIEKIFKTCKG